ncbi:MAG: hypothetical protein DRN24_03965 [Thermoplasmata archaeon]|nr:MAG: hypothetical protein DRN24_03965 [Thermoplasmata archaeon]
MRRRKTSMNRYHFLSLICFIGAVVFLFFGFLNGDVKVGVFIVFPFITGSGVYSFFGTILLFLMFLFFILGFIKSVNILNSEHFLDNDEILSVTPEKKTSFKGGGVILIGPIPIVFGSNWKIVVFLMIIAILLMILFTYFFIQ